MRVLFWVLLLVNAVFFAVMQRGGPGWGEPAYQPQPALQQEKIRVLSASPGAPARTLPDPSTAMAPAGAHLPAAASAPLAIQSASTASPGNPATPANTTLPAKPVHAASAVSPVSAVPANPIPAADREAITASQIPAAKPVPAPAKQHVLACLEWGDFSGADLKRAMDMLSSLQLGDKLSQRQIEYDKGYWVYIPPQKTLAAANKTISRIKALGVKEYFIVRDAGVYRYAISLGVFKSQEAAQNYLDELRTKGVQAARIGERALKLRTTMFVLDKVDAATEAALAAAKQDFPGSELHNLPCAHEKAAHEKAAH